MSAITRIASALTAICLCAIPAVAGTQNASRKPVMQHVRAAQQVQEPAPAPVVPEPPPTPEQLPATPPQVTMSGGQLSIVAENSTLGDVLSAVRNLTGAGLEVPSGTNSERVVVHLGPGNPQQVLQQLFAGSRFNYIILGSPDNSAGIQKIILTSRTAGGASGPGPVSTPNADNNPYNRVHSQQPPPPDYQADSGVDDEIVQPDQPSAEEVTPPVENQPNQGQAQMPYAGPGGQAQQQQVIPLDQSPKTPEQLLQELQRMQQQQQQQNDPSRPPRSSVRD